MGFNRVARALRDVMQKILLLPVVNYLTITRMCTLEKFLQMLGWQIPLEAKKRLPPMSSLGGGCGSVCDAARAGEGA